MTTEPFWHRPRPPAHPPITPWEELDDDPAHPGLDGCARLGIERHWHTLQHDQLDTFQDVAVTAVHIGSAGGQVELGPWSMTAADARTLAASLHALADLAEPDRTVR